MKPVVLSASRMCDLPAWYPDFLISETEHRRASGQVIHTLVLWTKHPGRLLTPPLAPYLKHILRSGTGLYFHITVTGMGGRVCGKQSEGKEWKPEPLAPDPIESLACLEEVVKLGGSPVCVRLRIDPLLKVKDAEGRFFSNQEFLATGAIFAAKAGIRRVSFSLAEPGNYQKTDRRFRQLGISIMPFSVEDREALKKELERITAETGVEFSACSTPGFPVSSCIDGEELMRINRGRGEVSLRMPRSRSLCGCTHSVDIGGWPPRLCPTGCDYCYARPDYHRY